MICPIPNLHYLIKPLIPNPYQESQWLTIDITPASLRLFFSSPMAKSSFSILLVQQHSKYLVHKDPSRSFQMLLCSSLLFYGMDHSWPHLAAWHYCQGRMGWSGRWEPLPHILDDYYYIWYYRPHDRQAFSTNQSALFLSHLVISLPACMLISCYINFVGHSCDALLKVSDVSDLSILAAKLLNYWTCWKL